MPTRARGQGAGQMAESWDYMNHFLRLYPHPIMSFTASLMCFNRAVNLSGEEQMEQFRLQVALFERADSQLQETPLSTTSDKDVLGLMALGFQAAAITFARLGDLDRAKDVADRAISVDPQSRFPRELRELLNFQEGVITRDGRPTIAADAIIEEQWKRFQSESVKASHPLAL